LFSLSFSNSLSQEVLSRTPSQSASWPWEEPLSSIAGQELMDKTQSDQQLADGVEELKL
jgi:hypothetical protein